MENSNTYYRILGLPDFSSFDDVKKAYRSLSLLYHPDKHPENSAKFIEIAQAYKFLIANKPIYDNLLINNDVSNFKDKIRKVEEYWVEEN